MNDSTTTDSFAPRAVRIYTLFLGLVLSLSFPARAQTTNNTGSTNAPSAPASTDVAPAPASSASPSRGPDDSTFRIVAERNIFNANRSGGQVRLPSRRPSRVESFTLVGTLAYEKGAFAFFAGSSSEFSKPVKSGGVIAGHKIVDVLANGVKLEADAKVIELPVGSAMRREDEGAWQLADGASNSPADSSGLVAGASSRNNESSSRSGRSDSGSRYSRSSSGRGSNSDARRSSESAPPAAAPAPASADDESEVLKRMMERREKESP